MVEDAASPQRPKPAAKSGERKSAPGAPKGQTGSRPVPVPVRGNNSTATERGGYTSLSSSPVRGPRTTFADLEELRYRLAQMKKDARSLRGMEAAVRWDIAREEEKFKKTEELKDELKVMQDRAEFKDGLEQLIQENLHTEIVKELRDKKQYQEFKRAHKKAQKQEELQKTTDGYLDQKDFSEWTVQNKRVQMQEEQRMLVEAHLDTKNFYQEYKAQEKARKDMEEKEDRFEAEHKDLQLAFFKASQEREMAMDALEHARACQRDPLSTQHLLPTWQQSKT